jgi:hypothetical protein
MHRAQPFQKAVNVVVVENAGQQRLKRQVVCHAPYLTRPIRAIKPKLPGCDVVYTTGPPLLAALQPSDDPIVALGAMLIVWTGIAKGDDKIAPCLRYNQREGCAVLARSAAPIFLGLSPDGWRGRVLHLHPTIGAAGAIGRAKAL